MSEAERPEWLPEGWKMVIKTSMTGEKDVCYTCPTSSCTFNSKEEIMRYLNYERADDCISKPTSCFGDNVHPLAEQIKDFPDWLPAGWALEFKTRKSGIHVGRQYKCYIDPVTGYRFYSKNEVLRYIKDGMPCNPRDKRKRSVVTRITENACSSTNQRKGIKRSTMENVRSEIEYTPDGLPSGWIKEIRYRKANSRCGAKRDQYYTDPVNGYVFRSRKDAIQYIETGQVSKYAIKPKNRSTSGLYTSKKESHPSPAARRIKSRGTAVRRCLFSEGTPDSNVKMVTKINQLPERLSLPLLEYPSAQNMDGTDSSCKTLSNVKEFGNSKDAPNDGKLDSGCNAVGVSGQTLESETVNDSEPAIDKSSEPLSHTASEALNKTLDDLSPRKLDMVHENLSEIQAKEPDEAADKIPRELEIMRPLQQENISLQALEVKLVEERKLDPKNEEQMQPNNRRRGRKPGSTKAKARKPITVPLLASNLEVKLVEERKLDSKNEEQMQPNNRRRGRKPGSTKAKALKAMTMPLRASKRLAALRADRMASSGAVSCAGGAMGKLSDRLQAYPTATKKNNQQKEVPFIDLEILEEPKSREHPGEQAAPVKQVYLGELNEDKPGSPLRLPFGDSWPDPCIEFAFKTLTGDIPVLEDTAAIEEYFHQHLGTGKSPGQQGSASLAFGNHESFSQGEFCVQLQPPDNQLSSRDDGRPCLFETGLQSSQKGSTAKVEPVNYST
ncbi:hypothetical protein COCNU_07G012270 [Cocos nucifera]|uniref:MBD domain-containing protein n=1 Tax=Cocos nucifera TaxID=13894 RepID=A0A8K0N4U4_COCNU|nr:hypothetical protein COCNU_07G012270 [Cocos nucifera]